MIKKKITFTDHGCPSIWNGVKSFGESILVLNKKYEIKKEIYTSIHKNIREGLVIVKTGDIIVQVTKFSTNIYKIKQINKNHANMLLEELKFEKNGQVFDHYRNPIRIAQFNLEQVLSKREKSNKNKFNKKSKCRRKVG